MQSAHSSALREQKHETLRFIDLADFTCQIPLEKENIHFIAPKFGSEPPVLAISGEELYQKLKPRLQEAISALIFDKLRVWEKLLEEHLRNVDCSSNRSIFESYQSYDGLETYSDAQMRGTCLGHSQILKCVASPAAFIILRATDGSEMTKHSPAYDHAAVAIRFQNPENRSDQGVLLIEPWTSGILLYPGMPVKIGSSKGNTTTFELDKDQKTISVVREDARGVRHNHYPIDHTVENPAEVISKAIVALYETFPISRVDAEGNLLAAVNIRIASGYFEVIRPGEERVLVKFDDFSQFKENPANSRYFEKEFTHLLDPNGTLWDRIGKVIRSREIYLNLQSHLPDDVRRLALKTRL